jgi:predicted PurR-regulated permease PerM
MNNKPVQFWIFVAIFTALFIWLFQGILAPFIVGFIVAYLLNPIVEKSANKNIPRWASAILILAVFFIFVLIGLLFAIPVLVREMVDFFQLLPSLIQSGHTWATEKLNNFGVAVPQNMADLRAIDTAFISEKSGDVLNAGKSVLGGLLKGGMAIIGVITFLVLMPIVAFYMMVDWPRIIAKFHDLLPQNNKKRIKEILSDIDTSLSGFIRGQLTVCLLLGGFYAIALSFMGLQYGFFIGVAAGLLSIIPYIGSMFGLIASVGMAFYQFGGWEYPLIALVIFALGQLVEGNYLTPKLVGGSVGLHPLWVIFVLMAGGALMGFVGMMIAVPVAAIIAVLIRHGLKDYKQSAYFKGK